MYPKLSSLLGYSLSGQSQNKLGGSVTLYRWLDGPGASAGILALEVAYDGQKEYLHFGPKNMEGVADRSWDKLTQGIEGDFVASLDDAKMIEGYRRDQGIHQTHLSYTLGDNDKLAEANAFGAEVKDTFKSRGEPTETLKLMNLNAYAMLQKIKILKKNTPQFAPMSGTMVGDGVTENCASIIYKVLQAGGADSVIPPLNDELGRLDLDYLVPAIVVLGTLGVGLIPAIEAAFISYVVARFAGGALEGHEAASSLIKLMEREKNYTLPAGLALELAYCAISGAVGTLSSDSAPLRLNVLPEDVWNFARELHKAQNNCDSVDMHTLTERIKPKFA